MRSSGISSKTSVSGNKALYLRQLWQGGFKIPVTFVIPARAQNKFYQDPMLTRKALFDEFEKLLDSEMEYAVRSSAQIEDGDEYAFADHHSRRGIKDYRLFNRKCAGLKIWLVCSDDCMVRDLLQGPAPCLAYGWGQRIVLVSHEQESEKIKDHQFSMMMVSILLKFPGCCRF